MQGLARTNYFHVKDAALFMAIMARYEVQVVQQEDKGLFAVISNTDDGGFPTQYVFGEESHLEFFQNVASKGITFDVKDRDLLGKHVMDAAVAAEIALSDQDLEFGCDAIARDDFIDSDLDFPYFVATHLVDGEILVYTVTGYEKGRVGWGYSGAIRGGDLEYIQIDIHDIYAMAEKKFGTKPTEVRN